MKLYFISSINIISEESCKITSLRVKDRGMDDLLHDILTKLNRSHRCQKTELCKNEENKKKVLKTFDTTWMIPFDLSQKKFTPDKIRSLPRAVEVSFHIYWRL